MWSRTYGVPEKFSRDSERTSGRNYPWGGWPVIVWATRDSGTGGWATTVGLAPSSEQVSKRIFPKAEITRWSRRASTVVSKGVVGAWLEYVGTVTGPDWGLRKNRRSRLLPFRITQKNCRSGIGKFFFISRFLSFSPFEAFCYLKVLCQSGFPFFSMLWFNLGMPFARFTVEEIFLFIWPRYYR